jgi:hypothetical protein
MQRDDVCLIPRDAQKLPVAISHVTMRRAVESVTPYAVPPVKLVRQRVEESAFRQALVKGRVEDGGLRQSRSEHFARGNYPLDVRGIVQGRQVYAVLYASQDIVSDEHGVREALAAVYNPVAYGVYVRDRLNFAYAGSLGAGPANYKLYGGAHVPELRRYSFGLAPRSVQGDYGLAAYALKVAASEPSVCVPGNLLNVRLYQLKPYRRASTIQYQYVHSYPNKKEPRHEIARKLFLLRADSCELVVTLYPVSSYPR